MTKLLILGALVFAFVFDAAAKGPTAVRGYTRSNGTYVAPHYRSAPNSSRIDNYSTRGNVNPFTGKTGTVDPYAAPRATPSPSYGYPSSASQPQRLTPAYDGTMGGQY